MKIHKNFEKFRNKFLMNKNLLNNLFFSFFNYRSLCAYDSKHRREEKTKN